MYHHTENRARFSMTDIDFRLMQRTIMETSEKCDEIQKKCTKENSFSHKKSS